MRLHVRTADLGDSHDGEHIIALLDAYAREPVGLGKPLPGDVRERLIPALRNVPNVVAFLALDGDEAVGIAVCFVGFSTFRARPLLNIHDLAVLPQHRDKGVGRRLLEAAEAHARREGCCRLTLEVLETNSGARALYRRFGFDDTIVSRFLVKPLDA